MTINPAQSSCHSQSLIHYSQKSGNHLLNFWAHHQHNDYFIIISSRSSLLECKTSLTSIFGTLRKLKTETRNNNDYKPLCKPQTILPLQSVPISRWVAIETYIPYIQWLFLKVLKTLEFLETHFTVQNEQAQNNGEEDG